MRNIPNSWRTCLFSIAAGLAVVSCLITGTMPSAFAQSKASKSAAYHTPGAGSAERRAIMDALRGPVQKDVKTSVIFVVDDPKRFFRVAGNWAFVNAQFVHPDGSPMGKAYFRNDDGISDNVQALLRRVKGNGRSSRTSRARPTWNGKTGLKNMARPKLSCRRRVNQSAKQIVAERWRNPT